MAVEKLLKPRYLIKKPEEYSIDEKNASSYSENIKIGRKKSLDLENIFPILGTFGLKFVLSLDYFLNARILKNKKMQIQISQPLYLKKKNHIFPNFIGEKKKLTFC